MKPLLKRNLLRFGGCAAMAGMLAFPAKAQEDTPLSASSPDGSSITAAQQTLLDNFFKAVLPEIARQNSLSERKYPNNEQLAAQETVNRSTQIAIDLIEKKVASDPNLGSQSLFGDKIMPDVQGRYDSKPLFWLTVAFLADFQSVNQPNNLITVYHPNDGINQTLFSDSVQLVVLKSITSKMEEQLIDAAKSKIDSKALMGNIMDELGILIEALQNHDVKNLPGYGHEVYIIRADDESLKCTAIALLADHCRKYDIAHEVGANGKDQLKKIYSGNYISLNDPEISGFFVSEEPLKNFINTVVDMYSKYNMNKLMNLTIVTPPGTKSQSIPPATYQVPTSPAKGQTLAVSKTSAATTSSATPISKKPANETSKTPAITHPPLGSLPPPTVTTQKTKDPNLCKMPEPEVLNRNGVKITLVYVREGQEARAVDKGYVLIVMVPTPCPAAITPRPSPPQVTP